MVPSPAIAGDETILDPVSNFHFKLPSLNGNEKELKTIYSISKTVKNVKQKYKILARIT